jgi:hypothetical protein
MFDVFFCVLNFFLTSQNINFDVIEVLHGYQMFICNFFSYSNFGGLFMIAWQLSFLSHVLF